jgi:hypothetical protein
VFGTRMVSYSPSRPERVTVKLTTATRGLMSGGSTGSGLRVTRYSLRGKTVVRQMQMKVQAASATTRAVLADRTKVAALTAQLQAVLCCYGTHWETLHNRTNQALECSPVS